MAPDLEDHQFRLRPQLDPSASPRPYLDITAEVDGEDDCVALVVRGEIDLATAPTLQACLDDRLTHSTHRVTIDLAGVTFLDSSGINLLIRANNRFAKGSHCLRVRNPTPAVRRVLTIAGVEALILGGPPASDARPASSPTSDPDERLPAAERMAILADRLDSAQEPGGGSRPDHGGETDAALIAALQGEVAGLRNALESRATIEQAKGIIMASVRCDPDAAFRTLVQQSQGENRKLREIAEDLVAAQSSPAVRGVGANLSRTFPPTAEA